MTKPIYQAVFFDLDGTLVFQKTLLEDRIIKVAENLNLRLSRVKLPEAIKKAMDWFWENNIKFEGRTDELYYNFLIYLLKVMNVDGDIENLAARIGIGLREFPDDSQLYPEAEYVLKELNRQGLTLAVVSGRGTSLHQAVKTYGIDKYFKVIVSTTDANANKSDPRLYQFALHKLGIKPEITVHIGDYYEGDVRGARGAGITPILVDRSNRYFKVDCWKVKNLKEALVYITGQTKF